MWDSFICTPKLSLAQSAHTIPVSACFLYITIGVAARCAGEQLRYYVRSPLFWAIVIFLTLHSGLIFFLYKMSNPSNNFHILIF